MKRTSTTALLLPFLPVLCVLTWLFGCAANLTPQQRAIQAAEVSFMTYEGVSNAEVTAKKSIMDLRATRQLTREERQTLSRLDDLKNLLDRYAVAHNTYIKALKIGVGVEAAYSQVAGLWNRVRTDALALKLVFNAVSP